MNRKTELFYQRILEWVLRCSGNRKGFLVGINAPQGAGKTTLTAALCRKLSEMGKASASISIDDFYLTRAEQIALADRYPGNPYLQQRGYPGTHDISLGTRILEEIKGNEPGEVLIPRYDKSLHSGKGDRVGVEHWTRISKPLDIIFFEGWILGATPVLEEEIPDPALKQVNAFLASYDRWHQALDAFLQIDPEDPLFVLEWRVEAEEKMTAAGKGGMSAAEIRSYVELFLPAYKIYLPKIRKCPPPGIPSMRLVIGKNRLPSNFS